MRTQTIDLKLLIIDEISMVGARTFHYIDQRLKQIFHTVKPFGGLSVILVGDFKQLKPVGDVPIYRNQRNDPYVNLYGIFLWEMFKYFTLKTIMRQKDDMTFSIALNNMSIGRMTENDVQLFQIREHKNEDVPLHAIHLFQTNAEVDHYNSIKINQSNEKSNISRAKDFGVEN